MTVKEALDGNRGVGPGFHWLRHALSIAIVANHCRAAIYFSMSGLVNEGGVGTSKASDLPSHWPTGLADLIRPGLFSLVGMFFALSGFLVTGSAVRNPKIGVFFANRALRILPALSVEVVLSACIIGPLCTTLALHAYLADPKFVRYFGNILGDVYFYLPGVFNDLPWPGIVNGNLWTLPAEFWCYALMMAAMVTGVLSDRRVLLFLLAIFFLAATALGFYDEIKFGVRLHNQYVVWYVVAMFWVGAAAFRYADYIPIKTSWFLISVASFWFCVITGFAAALSGIFLCYCMLYLGMLDWKWWNRNIRADHSYGIYLYGFPLMQTVVHFWQPYYGPVPAPARVVILFIITTMLTLTFAEVSWRFVEKPALSLKRRFANNPTPAAGLSDA